MTASEICYYCEEDREILINYGFIKICFKCFKEIRELDRKRDKFVWGEEVSPEITQEEIDSLPYNFRVSLFSQLLKSLNLKPKKQ